MLMKVRRLMFRLFELWDPRLGSYPGVYRWDCCSVGVRIDVVDLFEVWDS